MPDTTRLGFPITDELKFLAVYLTLFLVAPALYRSWRRRISQSWPSATACVHTAVLRQEGKEKRWVVRVSYTFHTAAGERYGGTAGRYVGGPEKGEVYLARIQGTTVPVRYKPDDPEDSIAELP